MEFYMSVMSDMQTFGPRIADELTKNKALVTLLKNSEVYNPRINLTSLSTINGATIEEIDDLEDKVKDSADTDNTDKVIQEAK